MERRAVLAVLLAAAFTPAFAEFNSPTYGQAGTLASGQATAGATYDGAPTRGAVTPQVSGALATGGLAAQPDPQRAVYRSNFSPASIPGPAPDTTAKKDGGLFSKAVEYAPIGLAVIGGVAGFFLGGGIVGALVGALVGAGIGWLLKKMLG